MTVASNSDFIIPIPLQPCNPIVKTFPMSNLAWIQSLKYQRSKTPNFKDIGIRKFTTRDQF